MDQMASKTNDKWSYKRKAEKIHRYAQSEMEAEAKVGRSSMELPFWKAPEGARKDPPLGLQREDSPKIPSLRLL